MPPKAVQKPSMAGDVVPSAIFHTLSLVPSFAPASSDKQVGTKFPREKYSKPQFKNSMPIIKKIFFDPWRKTQHMLNA